jgi:hypothetical protein
MVPAPFKQSQYRPKVRSLLNVNLIKDLVVGDFVLELKMLSMSKEYTDRDMCLFFGPQDPSHFYYVHIANRSDPSADSIFVVDDKPRVSIQRGWAKTEKSKGLYDFSWLDVIWFDCNNIDL